MLALGTQPARSDLASELVMPRSLVRALCKAKSMQLYTLILSLLESTRKK